MACSGDGLFDPAARHGTVDLPSDPWVQRIRRVEVDFSRILSGAQTAEHLTLDLFPDVCLHAVRDRAKTRAGGMVQWDGHLAGTYGGSVTLIVNDSTLLVGMVRTDRDVYGIRYLGGGVHAVLSRSHRTERPVGRDPKPGPCPRRVHASEGEADGLD